MTSVLDVETAGLRRAAGVLGGVERDLNDLAARVGGLGAEGSWRGLAGLAHDRAVQELREGVRVAAVPGRALGDALRQAADDADRLASSAREGLRVRERGQETLDRLRGAQPSDPLLEPVWRQRVAEAEAEVERGRQLLARAEADWEGATGRACAAIAEAQTLRNLVQDLRKVPADLRSTYAVARATVDRLYRSTEFLVGRALGAFGGSARLRARGRLTAQKARQRIVTKELGHLQTDRDLVRKHLSRPAGAGSGRFPSLARLDGGLGAARKATGRVPGPLGAAAAVWSAKEDVSDGAGRTGWRGTVTRVTAGGALAGGGVALVGGVAVVAGCTVGAPLVAVGLGAVGVYQVWTNANDLGDLASSAWRYGKKGWQAGSRMAGEAGERISAARQRAEERLGTWGQQLNDGADRLAGRAADLGGQAVEAGQRLVDAGGDVLEGVGEGLRRPPDLPEVDLSWRPDLPDLGSGLRLPRPSAPAWPEGAWW